MASKVKEIHQYDGTQWGQAVPIGADASNVDVKTSDNTDISLQSVLGSFNATEPSIKTQINGKVEKEGGDVAHAVINDPVNQIPIYDLDTEETSEKLISDDISTDTDMVVMSGDGENLTTMWGKFNRFRKRVDNKFKNYLVTSLEGVAPGASSDTKGYSTQALNNYFNDVIGYTSAASVAQTGSVASQLSSLNSNMGGKDWSDYDTLNTTNTWIPVSTNDNKMQHRFLPANVGRTEASYITTYRTSGSISFIKGGNCVTVELNAFKLSRAITTRVKIGTIPAQFRPPQTTYMFTTNTSSLVYLLFYTNGDIMFNPPGPSGTSYWGTCSWVMLQ